MEGALWLVMTLLVNIFHLEQLQATQRLKLYCSFRIDYGSNTDRAYPIFGRAVREARYMEPLMYKTADFFLCWNWGSSLNLCL